MQYAETMRRIAEEYAARKRAYLVAEAELFETDPEFASVEGKLRDMTLRKVKGEPVSDAELAALESESARLRAAHGLTPPLPRCARCGDTGKVNGKYCDCVVSRACAAQDGEIRIPTHSFADVDFAVYGEREGVYRKLFADVETICRKYPHAKTKCIVLSGLTGTGKTYLAGCAANCMLECGQSVMALTAFAANDRFRKYHTCFDANRDDTLAPLLDCSLLAIDDLGTESILKNVTIEYLYLVLNERMLAGKLTLVTTNLTPDGVLARYGERIYSRLYDKSLAYAKFLQGKDLRSYK